MNNYVTDYFTQVFAYRVVSKRYCFEKLKQEVDIL